MLSTLCSFVLMVTSANAEDLKSILAYASANNHLILASNVDKKAKEMELHSQRSSYYPTIDVGMMYQRLDARTITLPGDVYAKYAKVGFDIYDGGRNSSLVKQKRKELESSTYDSKAMKKNISLQIVQDFYNIKSLEASLLAFNEAKRSLGAQLLRMKQFYEAKLATKDDVERLQSAYDTNIYEIESIKFQILSLKESLNLKVGKRVDFLEDSSFKELSEDEYELRDDIRSLLAKKDAVLSAAEVIDSVYYPNIRLEDTYSFYEYGRTDLYHPEGLDKQNKILITLNVRVFDKGTAQSAKEVILMNAQALNNKIEYQKNEQKMQYELSKQRIKTGKIKIKSALSALVSATSAFKSIDEKYNAGLVDNVAYLDALSAQTKATALYKRSLNDLEVAYATYYYYSGKELEDFLQ